MKLKVLAGLINRAKELILLTPENGGPQWAGDGRALYCLEGLPAMSCMELLRMMDIPEAKAAEIDAKAQSFPAKLAPYIRGLDTKQGLKEIFPSDETFTYKGVTLCPFYTRDSTAYLFQSKYLKPLENADRLSFWLARPGMARFVIAYDGLFPVALLFPFADGKGEVLNYLETMVTKFRFTSAWSNAAAEAEQEATQEAEE